MPPKLLYVPFLSRNGQTGKDMNYNNSVCPGILRLPGPVMLLLCEQVLNLLNRSSSMPVHVKKINQLSFVILYIFSPMTFS